jgi:hypothetical protein
MAFRVGGLLRAIASGILEIDDTAVPYEQLEILNDFLSKHRFSFDGKAGANLLAELKRKHMVDSITVIGQSGDLVVSSEGNGHSEGAFAASLLRQIDSELATPETLMIKGIGSWFMVFPFNEKTYIIRAPASLSSIELKALANDMELAVIRE